MDKRQRTSSLRVSGESRPALVSSLPVAGFRSAPGSPDAGSPSNSRPGSPKQNGKPITPVQKLQLEVGAGTPAPKLFQRGRRSSSITLGSPLPIVKHSVETDYDLLEVIGQGKHKKNPEDYAAVKILSRARISFTNFSELAREVSILKKLRHDNIIGLKDVYITEEHLQIVMELCRGRELFDVIVERHTFTEKDAKQLVKAIIEPISYLHMQGIVHRDLKPENIMFMKEDSFSEVKIVDFGFARHVSSMTVGTAGTLGYKAPEVFAGRPVGPKADMWSIGSVFGVLTYILLCGFPPFFSHEHFKSADMLNNAPFWFFFNEETEALINEIKSGNINFPPRFWETISDEAKDFISGLLQTDESARLSAHEALSHTWFSQETVPATPRAAEASARETVNIMKSFVEEQRRSRAKSVTRSMEIDHKNAMNKKALKRISVKLHDSNRDQVKQDLRDSFASSMSLADSPRTSSSSSMDLTLSQSQSISKKKYRKSDSILGLGRSIAFSQPDLHELETIREEIRSLRALPDGKASRRKSL